MLTFLADQKRDADYAAATLTATAAAAAVAADDVTPKAVYKTKTCARALYATAKFT